MQKNQIIKNALSISANSAHLYRINSHHELSLEKILKNVNAKEIFKVAFQKELKNVQGSNYCKATQFYCNLRLENLRDHFLNHGHEVQKDWKIKK